MQTDYLVVEYARLFEKPQFRDLLAQYTMFYAIIFKNTLSSCDSQNSFVVWYFTQGFLVIPEKEQESEKVINPGSEFVILESDTRNKKEMAEEDMQETENRFLNHICEVDIVCVVKKMVIITKNS